jgi:hypothetical protein
VKAQDGWHIATWNHHFGEYVLVVGEPYQTAEAAYDDIERSKEVVIAPKPKFTRIEAIPTRVICTNHL